MLRGVAEQRFRAIIRPEGGSAYIELDFDVAAEFETKGRVSVRGSIDGHPFTTSISPRHGRWYVVVNRQMRQDFGVGPGDEVDVVIDRDDAPRAIAAPPDLEAAIEADDEAARRWAAMSFSHRKQYVSWIEQAKKTETRARRIEQAVPMIAEGARRST
jgi:hypothetical protein